MPSVASVVATYALIAVGLAVALVAVLHLVEPEYDPSWRMLSEYSLGRFGWVMRIAFMAAGTGVIAAAMVLPDSAWLGRAGLVLVAFGPLGAAFVDTDPITTPRQQMSRRSNVHAALGSLFILGFPIAATLAGLGAAGDANLGWILAVASIAPWLVLAWFLGTSVRHARPDGVGAADVPIGWPNRASMLVYLGWVALAAALVLR